jgi:uncharacterized protein (TIGR02231 family)
MYKSLLIMLLFCSSLLTAQTQDVRTVPSEATVYLNSAKVTETASFHLKKGKNTLKVVGLPNNIDINSYQIGLSNGATLLSVSPSTNYLKTDEYSAEEQQLLDNKKGLQLQQKLVEAEVKTLEGELRLIEKIQSSGNTDNAWTAVQIAELASYYAKRTLEIRTLLIEKNMISQGILEQISDLDMQIRRYVKDKNVNRNEVVLEIQSSKPMHASLNISFITSAAGWQPFYDIRAKSITAPLEIITKGKVYQNTGKPWDNIQLRVSTYFPRSNQDRPILNPFYVREAQYPSPLSGQVRSVNAPLDNSYKLREDSMVLDEAVVVSEAVSQQFNTLYTVDGRQSVSTNTDGQTFILDKKSVEADYLYHTVPKRSEEVFLLANIKNWQSLNLLLTEANIYFQDHYIGKTTINPNYTSSTFSISLGVDERIIVKRRLLDNLRSTKLLSSKKVENYAYEISLKNNRAEEIAIEILDQIPISQHKNIELINVETNGGKLDNNTGSVLWKVNLKEGENKRIMLSYQLKYPEDVELQFY